MVSRTFFFIIFHVGFLLCCVRLVSSQSHARRKWLTEIFLEARNAFILDEQVNPQCRNDFNIYTSYLANQTAWAVRMLESSHWPTLGLLSGVTTHLGNWAECLNANGDGVSGQYCLVQSKLNYTFHEEEDSYKLAPDNMRVDDDSAWQLMQKFEKNPIHLSRLTLSWALCVPSSCTIEDIIRSLENTLVPLFAENGLGITVKLEPNLCSISTESAYPLEFYCMTLGIVALFVSTASISCYYIIQRRKTCIKECAILQCFSLEYNLEKLYHTSLPSYYNIIYMFKVLEIIVVIGGHLVLIEAQSPMFQTEEWEKLFYPYQCFTALDSCVDIFSVISGFLMFRFNLDAAKQRGLRFVVFKVVSQWAKLSGLITLHLLFAINIWPYQGDGPLWKQKIYSEAQKCRQNWWMNILAVTNYYPSQYVCLLHTWYLSVNVQLSIIGGLLLYVFAKSEARGIFVTMTVFLSGVFWTCFLVYSDAYNSILLGYIKTLNNLEFEKDFMLYIATSTRMGPYLLGFITALITSKLKDKKFVFSKLQVWIILSVTAAVAISFAYYRKWFNAEGRQYRYLENAIYASLSRSFLILPFASFMCLYYTSLYSEKSFFNTLSQNKIWLPLGRLVPNVYMIHYPLILTMAMSRRTYSSNRNETDIFWQWAAASYYSFVIAFFWFLIVQCPAANMIKLIFTKLMSLCQTVQLKNDTNKNFGNPEYSENWKKIE